MKVATVLIALCSVFLGANAKNRGACGCQINTDGAIDTSSTQSCCDRYGGTTTYLVASGRVRFSGDYCLRDDIDGNSFYNCCRQFIHDGDSACPW